MKCATQAHVGSLHLTLIEPIDPNIVRIYLTSKICGWRTKHNDVALYLYASLMLSGTRARTKSELSTYLRMHGIQITISEDTGMLTIKVTVRKEKVRQALAFIEEILLRPEYSIHEFKIKRKTALETNREERDNTRRIAEIHFRSLAYPPQSPAYLQSLDEERVAIEKQKHSKLLELRDDILKGEWYVSVVGDTPTQMLVEQFSVRLFSSGVLVSSPYIDTRLRHRQYHYETVLGKNQY